MKAAKLKPATTEYAIPDEPVALETTPEPELLPEAPQLEDRPWVWADEASGVGEAESSEQPTIIESFEHEEPVFEDFDGGLSIHVMSGLVTTNTGESTTIDSGHVYEIHGGGFSALIGFQQGPVPKNGINGVTNEALLRVLIHRTCLINEKFPCDENLHAISYMEAALNCFNDRTARRKKGGIEGTYAEETQPTKPKLAVGCYVYDQYHNAGEIVAEYANFAEYAADPQNFITMKPDSWLAAQEQKHTEQELGEKWYEVKILTGGSIISPESRLYSAEESVTESLGDLPIEVQYVSKNLFDQMKDDLQTTQLCFSNADKTWKAKQAEYDRAIKDLQRMNETQAIELKRWQGACLNLTDVVGDMRLENQSLGQEILGMDEEIQEAHSQMIASQGGAPALFEQHGGGAFKGFSTKDSGC